MAVRATSREARRNLAGAMPTLRQQVYDFLIARGREGATDEEMQQAIPMNPNTQRPRRRELEQALMILDSGRKRKTESGSNAVVWVVKDHVQRELF